VNAALSNAQRDLPATAKVQAHRMTFASFPVLGYSLTSTTASQTRLWEMATYEIKPRLNRLDGVAQVIVQGGQEPEFHVVPDPAKLLQASVTVPDLLEAVRRTNLIDSPGLLERNHQLYLGLSSGQVRDPQQIASIVVKISAAGVPVRLGDVARVDEGVRPLYTVVTANGKPAVLLNVNRQPESNSVQVAEAVIQAGRRRLRPIVMTALAAVAGMLPLAFAMGAGSQMLKPLAIAVIGGVLLSMILSLIITPAVYLFATRRASRSAPRSQQLVGSRV
jgi:multidrug efflux pump subunit AcrB